MKAGKPKYSFSALVLLAIDGLISFSNYPLRLVTRIGIMTTILAVAMTVWILIDAFFQKTAPSRVGKLDRRCSFHGISSIDQFRNCW